MRPRLQAIGLATVLLLGGAACSTAGTSQGGLPALSDNELSPRLGVQLYSVRKQLESDFEGTLAFLRDMGVRSVETHNLFGRTADQFAQALRDHSLQAQSMMVMYEELDGDLNQHIANAKALGAHFVVCPWIPHQDDAYTAQDNDNAIALFNKVGAAFKQAGLRFLYHPHGYEFHDGGTGTPLIEQMLARTTPGIVDFEMDVYWVVNTGNDPVDYLRRFPGRFVLLHLKDMKHGDPVARHDGRTDIETFQIAAGTGRMDFPAIVAEALKQDAQWFFIEDESSRSSQQVPESFEYFRQLVLP